MKILFNSASLNNVSIVHGLFLRIAFACAQVCSMGFKSGL